MWIGGGAAGPQNAVYIAPHHERIPALMEALAQFADRYFQALGAYRAGNPNPIVELGAAASLLAVQNGRQLASEMAEARAEWNIKLRSVRSDSVVWRIVDTLIERPVLDADVANALDRFAERAGRRDTA